LAAAVRSDSILDHSSAIDRAVVGAAEDAGLLQRGEVLDRFTLGASEDHRQILRPRPPPVHQETADLVRLVHEAKHPHPEPLGGEIAEPQRRLALPVAPEEL
jgi:hypothetical protein